EWRQQCSGPTWSNKTNDLPVASVSARLEHRDRLAVGPDRQRRVGDDIAEALAGETAVWVECPGLLLAVGQGHLQRQAAVLQEDDVIEHGARQRWLEIRDGRVRTAEAQVEARPAGPDLDD